MHEAGHSTERGTADEGIAALLERVAAAMREIEAAKQERSAEDVQAVRTRLAALHEIVRLERRVERERNAG